MHIPNSSQSQKKDGFNDIVFLPKSQPSQPDPVCFFFFHFTKEDLIYIQELDKNFMFLHFSLRFPFEDQVCCCRLLIQRGIFLLRERLYNPNLPNEHNNVSGNGRKREGQKMR